MQEELRIAYGQNLIIPGSWISILKLNGEFMFVGANSNSSIIRRSGVFNYI